MQIISQGKGTQDHRNLRVTLADLTCCSAWVPPQCGFLCSLRVLVSSDSLLFGLAPGPKARSHTSTPTRLEADTLTSYLDAIIAFLLFLSSNVFCTLLLLQHTSWKSVSSENSCLHDSDNQLLYINHWQWVISHSHYHNRGSPPSAINNWQE